MIFYYKNSKYFTYHTKFFVILLFYCSPKLSEAERRKAAIIMDMRPISEEYERELK